MFSSPQNRGHQRSPPSSLVPGPPSVSPRPKRCLERRRFAGIRGRPVRPRIFGPRSWGRHRLIEVEVLKADPPYRTWGTVIEDYLGLQGPPRRCQWRGKKCSQHFHGVHRCLLSIGVGAGEVTEMGGVHRGKGPTHMWGMNIYLKQCHCNNVGMRM